MCAKIGSDSGLIKRERRESNLTEGVISKQLFKFAMPLLLGNLLQQVYFIADSIIVGRFIGSTALAAVGAASAITVLMVNFFTGMANGAGIILAQYVGAGDTKKLGKTIQASAIFTIIFGIICSVVGVIFTSEFLRLMDTPSDVFVQADNYLKYCFIGMLPMLIYNMGAACLQAMGDSRTPLYFLLAASVVNVGLDIFFVSVVGMDVEGTAIATCIAQAVAASLVGVTIIRRIKASKTEFEAQELHVDKGDREVKLLLIFKRIMVLGLPIGMQAVVINFSNIVVQSHINRLGSDVMAAWSAFCRVDGFVILPLMSFGLATMTFTGQNFGAKKPERILGGLKSATIMSCILTVITGLIIMIFAEQCFAIFTKSSSVIYFACQMVYYMVPFYAILAITRIYIGVISGTGNSIMPMIINILFMCVFRIIFIPVASNIIGKNLMVVYSTYWFSWVLSLLSILIYYRIRTKKQILQLTK